MNDVTIYIWQRPIKDKLNEMFVDYDEVSLNEFVLVYITKKIISFRNIEDYLEDLYVELSNDYPKDYYARSLGTSDLIMIRDPIHDKTENYVVNIQGFKKVKVKVGNKYE